MQNSVHDFDQQLIRGESGEAFLDGFFKTRGHYIQQATRGQQLIGVDRVFLRGGKLAYVEIQDRLPDSRDGTCIHRDDIG